MKNPLDKYNLIKRYKTETEWRLMLVFRKGKEKKVCDLRTHWFFGLRNYVRYLGRTFWWETLRGWRLTEIHCNDEFRVQEFRSDESFKKRGIKIRKLRR